MRLAEILDAFEHALPDPTIRLVPGWPGCAMRWNPDTIEPAHVKASPGIRLPQHR